MNSFTPSSLLSFSCGPWASDTSVSKTAPQLSSSSHPGPFKICLLFHPVCSVWPIQTKTFIISLHCQEPRMMTYFLPYKSKDFQGPSKVHSLCSLKFLIDPFCTVLSTTCTILLTLVTHHECLLPRCLFVKCYPCFKIPVMDNFMC